MTHSSAAGKEIVPEKEEAWLRQQQAKMKANRVAEVVALLRRVGEQSKPREGASTMRVGERYLSNHAGYFDYRSALEAGLPIGSREVEGGHRWVIHKRMSLSGAWWKADNAEKMLALRVVRANDKWQSYWEKVRQAAV